MIGIKIGDDFLDLGPSFRLEIVLVSPLFSGDIGYGSHSFRFRVPNSPHNRRLLKQVDAVLQLQKQFSFDVSLYLDHTWWASALLNVAEAYGKEINCSLEVSEGKLATLLSEIEMRNASLGGEQVIGTQDPGSGTPSEMIVHANATTTGDVDSHDWVFAPVFNEEGYGDNHSYIWGGIGNYDHFDWMNYWKNGTFSDEIRAFNADGTQGVYTLIPFPYLLQVLRYLLASIGYSIDESAGWAADNEIRTLTIYNTQTLDKGYVRQITTNFFTFNQYKLSINIADHVPDMNARDFLKAILNFFQLALIETENGVQFRSKNNIVADKSEKDWRDKTLAGYTGSESSKAIRVEEYQDGNDALSSGAQMDDGLDPPFVGTVATQADLPASPDFDDVYYVSEEDFFYRYELTEDGQSAASYSWKRQAKRRTYTISGADPKSETPGAGAPSWIEREAYTGMTQRVPHTQDAYNSPMYNMDRTEWGLRLMFYRGMVTPSGAPESYPMLSTDTHNPSGGAAWTYSLKWQDTGNMFDTWWRKWIEALQDGDNLTVMLDLNSNDVASLDWTKKHRIRVKEGEVRVLIKQVKLVWDAMGLRRGAETDVITVI